MRVIITGSSGFLGSEILRKLSSEGEVSHIILYDLEIGLDIHDPYHLYKSMSDADLVIHMAGETGVPRSWHDPIPYYMNNTIGSSKVFKVARELGKKVIYASTGEVYAGNSPYAASKIGAEAAGKTELLKGADIVFLRILNPYGIGQPNSYVIPRFVQAALHNDDITIHDGGKQRKDYIYVTDVASAFWAARKLPPGTFTDVGSGRTRSILELAETIIKLTGSKSKLKFVEGAKRPGELPEISGNIIPLLNTGWLPEVHFERGLKDVIEHYREPVHN